ncbi:hypothetical protein L3X38_027341 [Prunus dulcis]|uniref:Reverse transcriptase RNase H-like domain-containing protein n=1 Tax=Prunus dulcis TaxID=3755 RepID=A0AAD4VML9_PRUDU|nr:hypothetical protein L3X38_027341 [Prunus dulcis]
MNKRGIEHNPSKVEALRDMPDPRTPRDVQVLTGRIAALSRFISRSSDRCEPLYLYMAVTEIAVSAVLLREENSIQQPIFYVSKSLIEAEKRYTLAEKLVLALVTAKRKLRQYFEAHTIIILTTQPIRAVMSKPDLSGRVTKWAIELGAFDIRYQPQTAQKGQAGAGVGIVLCGPRVFRLIRLPRFKQCGGIRSSSVGTPTSKDTEGGTLSCP